MEQSPREVKKSAAAFLNAARGRGLNDGEPQLVRAEGRANKTAFQATVNRYAKQVRGSRLNRLSFYLSQPKV